MKRVLLVYPPWKPPGGSNAVAAWMIEALRGATDLTVLAWQDLDCDLLNRIYGTSLKPDEFRTVTISPTVRALFGQPTRWLLRYHVILRAARRRAADVDVVVSANDESDFGRPGIQYIHYPRFDDPRVNPRVRRPLELTDRWFHRSDVAMRAYFKLCTLVSGFTFESMRRNVTLVNSDWTGQRVRDVLDIPSRTVYPPVPNDFPDPPWESREIGFVALGRIAPEKETAKLIRILDLVRGRGHAPDLHLIGTCEHPEYLAQIRDLCATRPWVTLHGEVTRAELVATVSRQRYGIHGMAREHFGIAVAEMVNAGCLPFVPSDGGQVEIVGGDARLLYASPEEAAEKIARVLSDEALQSNLRSALAARRGLFSTERFAREIRDAVNGFAA